ncbi:MAG TPA: hypothetical protein ENF83_00705, partial [Candidatus Korarchaeota archaeon]|nr:hypothetical protein [Candidatus Korarchaeota archaeon]
GEDWDGDGTPEPPITCVFAAGNDGPDPTVSLDGPGIAKNVIQVGATTNPPFFAPGSIADFSSRGPTTDGRIKPDVVAPGYYVVGPFTGMYMYGWLTPDPVQALHVWAAGTSMATPQVAGAAALWHEIFGGIGLTPSPSATKALIVNFADWMGLDPTVDNDGNGNPDLYDMGFGQLDFYNWITYPGTLVICDECINVAGGWSVTVYFDVEDPSVPLRVTLAWNDPPQWTPGVPALINDIDLEVIAPDGTTYYGNDLTPPYDDQRDSVNNVERVIIDTPTTGRYAIRIRARSTPLSDPPVSLVIFGAGLPKFPGPFGPGVGGTYAPSVLPIAVAVATASIAGAAVVLAYRRRKKRD